MGYAIDEQATKLDQSTPGDVAAWQRAVYRFPRLMGMRLCAPPDIRIWKDHLVVQHGATSLCLTIPEWSERSTAMACMAHSQTHYLIVAQANTFEQMP